MGGTLEALDARSALRGMWDFAAVFHFCNTFALPLRLRKFTAEV